MKIAIYLKMGSNIDYMVQKSKPVLRDPRVTSRGWSLERGEYATISVPRKTNIDDVTAHCLWKTEQYPEKEFPQELREKVEISFMANKRSIFIRISVHTQDTRAEKFVDALVKGTIAVCGELPKLRK
jgi:hypothetical protein